jgi:hypothetical protein
MGAEESFILQPGRNCWRVERADRLALIVDAAGYFAATRPRSGRRGAR